MPEYSLSRWSLTDLFPGPDDPEIQKTIAQIEKQVRAFEKKRKLLSPRITGKAFLSILELLEAIHSSAYRIMGFAQLYFSEDTQKTNAQTLLANVQNTLTAVENRVLFFSLWWKALPPAASARLLTSAPKYRYFLEQMLNFRKFTLQESEEKIINLKNSTGSRILETLYQTLTNRYVFELDVDGATKKLTRGELTVYVRMADASLRERAYRSLYKVYEAEAPVLSQIYAALVRDWQNENVNLRGFRAPISVRNLANDIPDRVVHTLLEVCRVNAPIFQEYFRLKARRLGMDRLRRYDLYAPIAPSDKTYSFSQAQSLVNESFSRFDPRIAGLAKRILEENHLDSEVRPGKRDGAFCMSVRPKDTPWVLVNYQGRAYDISTLAHELGHGVHALLAAQQTIFTHQASLPLAETASTFGEMLLVDHLLSQEEDAAVREDLLFHQLDDAYATIGRQAFFALFEIEAHEIVKRGGSMEDLNAAYLANLKTQFGDSLDLSEDFRWEWTAIPHIFESPFYVYAYAFGQLLVLSLYNQFKSEGNGFVPRFMDILSAGGSASPATILRRAGIRIEQEAFWQGGFELLSGRIDQLKRQ